MLLNVMEKLKSGKQGPGSNVDEATITELGKDVVKEKYGNLFDMYEKITGENPYEIPMRIYPACIIPWVDFGWIMN